jgi:hypothetical protein
MFIDKVQVFQSNTASRKPSIVMRLSQSRIPTQTRQGSSNRVIVVGVVKVVELHPLWVKLLAHPYGTARKARAAEPFLPAELTARRVT